MSQEPEKKNNHIKTIGTIMVITLLGKVLGLVRDMMLGHNFATGMESTAFLVASRIPRTFFDAIFASAISASFIPIFNDRLENHGKEDAFQLSRSFFTWVGFLTAGFSLLGMAALIPKPPHCALPCCGSCFPRCFSRELPSLWSVCCNPWENSTFPPP